MFARSIAVYALLCLPLLAGLVAGQASARDVVSRVEFKHGALTIDHTQSIAQITQAQAKQGRLRKSPTRDGQVRQGQPATYGLGLFINDLKLEVSASEDSTRAGSVSVLTRIATSPTIYVAREFPQESCAYAIILAHERQHYLFDLDILRDLPADIERIAQDVFSANGSANRTQQLIDRVEHSYAAKSFAQHVAIDNLLAYGDLAGQCNGAIRDYVNKIGK
jgi:hypothetical protein